MPTRSISSFDLYKFTKELSFLNGGFVRNVKSRKNEIYILIFSGQEYWLKIVPGRYVSVSREKPDETIDFPFTAKLKNELLGKKIAISMHKSDRIIELDARDAKLIIELFSNGNISIVKDGIIEQALFNRSYGTRKIVSGIPFQYPPEALDVFNMELKDFSKSLIESKRENLVKALAVDFSLGGLYAEEVCYRVGFDKNMSPRNLEKTEANKIYTIARAMFNEASKPNIIENKFLAVVEIRDISGERRDFKTINDAINSYFKEEEKSEGRAKAFDPSNIENKIAEYSGFVNYITENYESIKDAIRTIRDSDESLESRKAKLGSFGWEVRDKFIYRTDNPEIQIDMTKPINDTLAENYQKIKRLKAALLKKPETKTQAKRLKFHYEEAWYSKFRWFFTSSNKLVVIGRDNSQNIVLVAKHTEPSDLLIHADVFGSPFGLLKLSKSLPPGENDLREAAEMVGSYSSAWKAGAGSIDVYAVKPEQVNKTPPSGESLKKGAFYIEGERTYIKDVDLKVYINLTCNVSEYNLRSLPYRPDGDFVLIRPGNTKREDILDRIIKTFSQKAGIIIDRDRLDRLIPTGRSAIEKIFISTSEPQKERSKL